MNLPPEVERRIWFGLTFALLLWFGAGWSNNAPGEVGSEGGTINAVLLLLVLAIVPAVVIVVIGTLVGRRLASAVPGLIAAALAALCLATVGWIFGFLTLDLYCGTTGYPSCSTTVVTRLAVLMAIGASWALIWKIATSWRTLRIRVDDSGA